MKKVIIILCLLLPGIAMAAISPPAEKTQPSITEEDLNCAETRQAVNNMEWVFVLQDKQGNSDYFPLPRKGSSSVAGNWCIVTEVVNRCGEVFQEIDHNCDGSVDATVTWEPTLEIIVIDDDIYVEFKPRLYKEKLPEEKIVHQIAGDDLLKDALEASEEDQ